MTGITIDRLHIKVRPGADARAVERAVAQALRVDQRLGSDSAKRARDASATAVRVGRAIAVALRVRRP
jgi:hypothetical protein